MSRSVPAEGVWIYYKRRGNDALSTKRMTIIAMFVKFHVGMTGAKEIYGTNLGWIVGVFLWYGHAAGGVEAVALSDDRKYATGIWYTIKNICELKDVC